MKAPHLLLILFALCACQKQNPCQESADSSLTINLESLETKAYSSDNESTTIASLDIFVFNEDGNLDISHACNSTEIGAKKAVLNLKTGQKTVYLLANLSPSEQAAARACYNLNALKAVALSLDSNIASSKCQPLLHGSISVNLTAAGVSTSVELRRYVSRVVLTSIRNSLPAPYGTIRLKRAFLCNAVGNQNIAANASASVWHNMDGTKNHSSAADAILSSSDSDCPVLLYKDLGEDLTNGSTKNYIVDGKASKTFYAYPNSMTNASAGFSNPFSPSASALMVVVEIKGSEYYYPVTLKNGMQANTESSVSLTILGLGNRADNPYKKIEKANLTASVTIANWSGSSPITEEI